MAELASSIDEAPSDSTFEYHRKKEQTTRGISPDVDNVQSNLRLFGDREMISSATNRHFGVNSEAEDLKQMTQSLCLGLGAVHKLHKCPPELRRYLYLGLCRFLSQFSDELGWVSGAKWLLTFPIARYLRNPEPPIDGLKRKLLFHKRYHRWLDQRFQKFSEKNTFFFTSWLQAKRCCEPLSSAVVYKNFLKHREGMLTTDPMTDDLLERIFEPGTNFTRLMNLVRKKLHSKLRDRVAKPSLHASYLKGRSFGGQRKDLIAQAVLPQVPIGTLHPIHGLRLYRSGQNMDESDYFQLAVASSNSDCLVHMGWLPHVFANGKHRCNFSYEVRAPAVYDDVKDLLPNWEGRPDSYEDPLTETYIPRAMAAPVMEPLKVRMVSAGPSRLYYSLKTFQLDLHSSIRTIPLFRLVGRPQSPTDLQDLIPDDLEDFARPRWLSADYAAATDNLSATLSAEILSRLSNGDGVFPRALSALGRHRISYPGLSVKVEPGRRYYCPDSGEWKVHTGGEPRTIRYKVPPVTQTNGQLMGSIVSFPILCLANAAALDLYQRDVGRKLTFEQYLRSALINGDDLVTIVDSDSSLLDFSRVTNSLGLDVTDDSHLYRFKKVSASLGLDLTVGKSYIHDQYANINSAGYHYDLATLWKRKVLFPEYPTNFTETWNGKAIIPGRLPVPREIEFFNTGLYAEKHKVQERVGSQSMNLDVTPCDPEFSAEIHDDLVISLDALPKGALKLYFRLKRRGISLPAEDDRPFWAVCNRVWRGTPSFARNEIERELSRRIRDKGEDIFFYRVHNERKKKWRWARRNHRLPVSAGGLGLFPESSTRFHVTDKQRMLADHLRKVVSRDGNRSYDSQLPLRQSTPREYSSRHPFSCTESECIPFGVYEYSGGVSKRGAVRGIIPCGGSPSFV